MTAKTEAKPLALPDQFKNALALVARSLGLKSITTLTDYQKAKADYDALIQHEKELDAQYNALQCVIDAKLAQAHKKELAGKFEAAKKYLKNGPMKAYDDEQERIRKEKEEQLRKEQQKKIDEENARLAKIEADKKKKADAEAKRLEEQAKKTRDKEEKKRLADEAEAAKKRSAEAEAEQARIKEEAAKTPAPAVVVEKSHQGVARREIFKYRLTAIGGRQFLKGGIKAGDRLRMTDFPAGTLPAHLFVLDPVLLNEFVDSNGLASAIKGTLEVKSEQV